MGEESIRVGSLFSPDKSMSEKTYIEWCDSSVNLQMGCDGCELWNPQTGNSHCYAGTLTRRYEGAKGWPEKFEIPKIFPERIQASLRWTDLTGKTRPDKPWLNGLPRLIFLNDMGDTFTESLPVDWLAPFLPEMADSPHQWLILTKRPRRFAAFAKEHPLPKNVWAGTSVTSGRTLKRIDELLTIPAAFMFISCEPILEPIDLARYVGSPNSDGYCIRCGIEWDEPHKCPPGFGRRPDWIIAGGESGLGSRKMNPDWARAIRDQCVGASVAFFMKQMDKKEAIPSDLFTRTMPPCGEVASQRGV